jgi:hypothetical protein
LTWNVAKNAERGATDRKIGRDGKKMRQEDEEKPQRYEDTEGWNAIGANGTLIVDSRREEPRNTRKTRNLTRRKQRGAEKPEF